MINPMSVPDTVLIPPNAWLLVTVQVTAKSIVEEAADVNGDGVIDLVDLLTLKRLHLEETAQSSPPRSPSCSPPDPDIYDAMPLGEDEEDAWED